jgi:pimeloyl-ACP methyl ester carboxylesterase
MFFIKILFAALFSIVIGVIAFVYLAPAQATRIALDAQRQHSGLSRKEVILPDGMHYVYLEGGAGEPLVLLHGFGANKDHFTKVARWLTAHFRVVIPDLPGFGESSRFAELNYTSAAQVERLRFFLQTLGIKAVHVGGSSMGGQIALAFAAAHPQEVTSLWLLDPAGIWSAPDGELATLIKEKGRNPLIAKSEDEFANTFSFVMTNPPFIPRPMLNVLAQEQIQHVPLAEKIFNQIVHDSVEQRVNGLDTPSLIVWGSDDRAINVKTAPVLNKLLPYSKLIIMRNTGHLPMVEYPRACAKDYLRFRGRALVED